MKDYAGKIIWIIGASSGIGKALAKELDSRGVTLILSARNEDGLNRLNQDLGNKHEVLPLDITDESSVSSAVTNTRNIDSTIFLAASYNPGKILDITAKNTADTIAINLEGTFTLIRHLIPYYKQKGHGQIALCGSVAGYKGLPGGQPYSATKAAIINLAESLYAEVCHENIDVKLISPGFVKTPLTDRNDFDMPMMIEPEEAAKYIADGLLLKKFEIHFPKKFTVIMKIINFLPYALYFPLAQKINR